MPGAIPDNYPDLVDRAAELFGESEAVRDGDMSLSFADIKRLSDECAAALVASGLEPGETVGIWAPNAWEWVIASMGTLRAGGVLVPVNTRFKGREAAFVLRKSKIKVLFTVAGFLGYDYVKDLHEAADGGHTVPSLTDVVVLRGDAPSGTISYAEFVTRATPEAADEVACRCAAASGEDLGLVMFTSGTTGLPKGVLVHQAPVLRNFAQYAAELGMRQGDRMLVVNPFFHAFGFSAGITPCIMRGATIHPHPVFDVESVLQRVQDERITILPGPPAIFQSLINFAGLDEYDTSSLRSSLTGAAAIPVETVVAMRERLGFETVLTGYGMTETHGLAAICASDDPPELVATTSGRALDGVELRIVDDEGRDLPIGQPGEILVRGYNVMQGYLDDPVASAEAIDEDGWLHTGDICVMNEQGYIDVTDRKKDMFINGGFNVYPAEIEKVMAEHPQIGQVAVVGVPDERLGEVGAAFVVPSPAGVPEADALRAWCRAQMANYRVPRYFWNVEALPLNPSNKVLKNELREEAAERLGT
ncbi:AMP-binding protein [Candidatus Poriferisodalis sp.]|uniref:AMP-binding protein n=1 Tax=Candidatus Poriferisodalis sp. TaxID=3101277 RepID=UPI003B5C3287